MRIVSFANLKGGVGKTTSALNFSIILANTYGYKVLLVDNDPQGNTSKFMNRHSYDSKSMENILSGRENNVNVIKKTDNDKIDIITSNMNMDNACTLLLLNNDEEQHIKLRNAFSQIEANYDYCVIDCQPGMGLNTINALVASDDVIIPVRIDRQAIDGVDEFKEFIDEIKKNWKYNWLW